MIFFCSRTFDNESNKTFKFFLKGQTDKQTNKHTDNKHRDLKTESAQCQTDIMKTYENEGLGKI